ncbi:hypothetical protein [Massilia sp. TS11]|uniref:hypothetical protein n=1 Tax=Massilia sp. TS11 TaxID=2908003 RepID=UPI001EDB9DB3|nr:hypothetical protein [Massilia sp. TS11]MCG2585823.1 hypothetical protein [Massilia sp. TS11]
MDRLETDTATVVSLWVGIFGMFLGVAGVGLTLYSFYRDRPDTVALTASGWGAAFLTAFVCGWVGKRLVKLIATLSNRVAELTSDLAELKAEKDRMVVIGEYLAAHSQRNARRKQSKSNDESIVQE